MVPDSRNGRPLLARRELITLGASLVVHYIAVILLLSGVLAFLFNDAMHRYGPGTDFFAYRNAAYHWLHSNGIYAHGPGFGFRYHPLAAMTLFAPLAWLKPYTAYYVWLVLNELLLLLDLFLLRRLFTRNREFVVASVLLLLFTPLWLELFMGNSSFFVASLLLAAFYFYSRGAYRTFTALTIVSIIIKPIGLVFLPILLFRKQWRLALAIFVIPVITAVPYFVFNPQDWAQFAAINFGDAPAGWFVHAGNQGLFGLMADIGARLNGIPTRHLAGLSQLPAGSRMFLTALPLLLVILTTWQNYRFRDNWKVCIFLWSAAYLLGYKDVWEHSYAFLILALPFLYQSGLLNKKLIVICAVGIALPTAFFLYDIRLPAGPRDPEHHWYLATAVVHHSTKVIWLVILYTACLRRSYRAASSAD
jgi:hypothetical protein